MGLRSGCKAGEGVLKVCPIKGSKARMDNTADTMTAAVTHFKQDGRSVFARLRMRK